eukprot:3601564-Rhodomonas_salina.2
MSVQKTAIVSPLYVSTADRQCRPTVLSVPDMIGCWYLLEHSGVQYQEKAERSSVPDTRVGTYSTEHASTGKRIRIADVSTGTVPRMAVPDSAASRESGSSIAEIGTGHRVGGAYTAQPRLEVCVPRLKQYCLGQYRSA